MKYFQWSKISNYLLHQEYFSSIFHQCKWGNNILKKIEYKYEWQFFDKNHILLKDLKLLIPNNYYWIHNLQFKNNDGVKSIQWFNKINDKIYGWGFITQTPYLIESYEPVQLIINNNMAIIKILDDKNLFYNTINSEFSLINNKILLDEKIYVKHIYEDKNLLIYYKDF